MSFSFWDDVTGAIGGAFNTVTDVAGDIFGSSGLGGLLGGVSNFISPGGNTNPNNLALIAGLGSLAAQQFGLLDGNTPPTGYQGGIPDYVAVQERVPQMGIAPPRPGAAGQRYFSDVIYAQKPESMKTPPTLEQARAMARSQVGLGPLNTGGAGSGMAGTLGGPGYGEYPLGSAGPRVPPSSPNYVPPPRASGGSGVGTGTLDEGQPELRAAGGLLGLARGGYFLGGMTDGMADKVPARIDGRQEARLSDGEFVVPADVVSHLGNGNSNAGAQQLYAMMDRVRKARTGREAQGRQINPSKYMPGMRA
jgi:hypothetical protein